MMTHLTNRTSGSESIIYLNKPTHGHLKILPTKINLKISFTQYAYFSHPTPLQHKRAYHHFSIKVFADAQLKGRYRSGALKFTLLLPMLYGWSQPKVRERYNLVVQRQSS